MTPNEVAGAVREHLAKQIEANDIDPADRHEINFVDQVCGHLRIEPTHLNHLRVRVAMGELGLDMESHRAFPKWVKGNLVHSADEESELIADESRWVD